jgi:hypothetical protein
LSRQTKPRGGAQTEASDGEPRVEGDSRIPLILKQKPAVYGGFLFPVVCKGIEPERRGRETMLVSRGGRIETARFQRRK